MNIEKRLILLVLVALIPLAYTRHTSLWGERLFSNDVIRGRHHSHKPQNVQISENPEEPGMVVTSIVDINGNNVGSQNQQYEVVNQQEPEIVIMDINGNVENLDNDKYEVGNEGDHGIVAKLRYDYSGQQVDLQNVKHEVHNQQNPEPRIVSYQKVRKFKTVFGNRIPDSRSEDVYVNDVDSEMSNNDLPIGKTSAIKTFTENDNAEGQLEVDDSLNEIDSDLNNDDLRNDETFPETGADTENNIPETPLITNDSENEVGAPSYTVCRTDQCRKLAQEFLSSMNTSANPCEDFYEFACGGWETVNPKPSYELFWSRNTMVEDSTNRRIKALLEIKSETEEILPVKQVKKWYRSCMNTEDREQRDLRTMASIMQQNGGWPMIMNEGEWHENEYNWQRVQSDYARVTGSYTFYDIYANYSAEGDEFGDIIIDAPKLSNSEDFLSLIIGKNDGLNFAAIAQVADTFIKRNGASVPRSRLLRESQELVLFQNALVKLIPKEDMDNSTSIEDLNDWYNSQETDSESASSESQINLAAVVQDVFNLANITVRPSTNIYIKKPAYVKGIGDLLKRTSPRTIVNYIHWKFFDKMWVFIHDETRKDFTRQILWPFLGLSGEVPRWLECVKQIEMKHAMSFAYVKKYYTKQTAKSIRAQEMIENIRAGLQQKIDNSNWMDSESKELTKQKLKSLRNFVGFPEWYTNNTAIINYYKGLEIGTDYLENHLSYMRYERKRKLERYLIPEPEDGPFNAETETPITVNAFYDQESNFAEYPAANFQAPFFGKDYPNAVNYGITGMLIGHEIGHAFDSCGITYGADGEKTKLHDLMLRSYYQRVDCFVDQYDEYNGNPKVENGTKWDCDNEDDNNNKSDGQRTAGENIADNTGLEAVFQAYKKLTKDQYVNGDVRLPGLEELTDNQLFFLSYAESWCEVGPPQYKRYMQNTHDVHSNERLRVIGPVSNTIGFAKAFNCPIGSPMNPVNKCNIWNKPDAKMNQASKRKNQHSWHRQ